jgi:hypothetical protein
MERITRQGAYARTVHTMSAVSAALTVFIAAMKTGALLYEAWDFLNSITTVW